MKKTVFLCSGQGSQYPGMGKALCAAIPEARRVYDCAGDILGFDVAKLSFGGAPQELARTLYSQPAIFTLSMAAFAALRTLAPMPNALAGHSLGEFAALCCAGAYSLEDGFRLIKARASAMEEAAGAIPGAMFAIVGSDTSRIAAACGAAEGFVVPVNFNLPNQTVISGEEEAAIQAAATLAAAGARAVRLSVSSAFHTKLMQSAADRFREEIAGIPFYAPKVDFYSNLTGGRYVPADFPEYFAAHMVSPVRFMEEVAAMTADGIEACVELGPGKAGSALVKKNNRAMTVANVESPEGLAFWASGTQPH